MHDLLGKRLGKPQPAIRPGRDAKGTAIGGDREFGKDQRQRGDVGYWPIATDDANRRFRGIADMDRFSSRNDL